jgi:type I restriction enzyme, R subunit
MLTGEIRNQIDRIWDAFWSGGIANPVEVIEQITYLLFLKRLDEVQQAAQFKAERLNEPLERRIFPEGADAKGLPYENFRWNRFKNDSADDMFTRMSEHIFPFLRTLGEVSAMTLDNFLVRPHRKAVEQFSNPESWATISPDDVLELETNLAGLPSTLPTETLEAKQFDLLLLRTQLTLLRGEPGFAKLRQDIETIARLLEAQSNIPAVAAKLPLIQEIQSPLFWEDITVVCLETVRKGLRDLVQFIERLKRTKIISDFVDTLGEESIIDLPGLSAGVDPEKFRDKALAFLRKHENDAVLHKLRFNEPLSAEDLAALEAIFLAEGSTPEEINAAKESARGLGLFVRSLIGLDRGAAKQALSSFMTGKTLTANQINFLDHVINHLAMTGWINPGNLYASPFTDLQPYGVDGVFDSASALALIAALQNVRENATPTGF